MGTVHNGLLNVGWMGQRLEGMGQGFFNAAALLTAVLRSVGDAGAVPQA
jgi:hypothetical protein